MRATLRKQKRLRGIKARFVVGKTPTKAEQNFMLGLSKSSSYHLYEIRKPQ